MVVEHRAGHQGQVGGVERSVSVHEAHDRRLSGTEPSPTRCSEAPPGLVDDESASGSSQLSRPVGGTVVDHDRAIAGGKAIQYPRQRLGLVEHREHDVDRGQHPRTLATTDRGPSLLVPAGLVVMAWWSLARVADRFALSITPRPGRALGLGAPPFVGNWDLKVTLGILVPISLAALFVGPGLAAARRMSWPAVVAGWASASATWVVALAVTGGRDGLTGGLGQPNDYLPVVDRIDGPGRFLTTFTDQLASYPVHVEGHPPGMPLALWVLDSVGLGGLGPAVVLVLALGSIGVAAVLTATRAALGEPWARRAAPFVALSPAAVFATTADYAYFGLAACSLGCITVACCRPGPRDRLLATAGGVLAGAALMGSYGMVLFALPIGVVCLWRRRLAVAVCAALGALSVVVLPLLWGFNWLDGLAATRERYWAGIASNRPAALFGFTNVLAFAALLGPVGLIALSRLRDRRAWVLVGGVGAAVVVALLSQMSKGEVERIWLPFAPWLLVACGGLRLNARGSSSASRLALGLQLVTAIALQAGLRSPW